MPEYHSPTVAQPPIPKADMTPLERLLLTHIFDFEEEGDGLYFYTPIGPRDRIELILGEFRTAFAASETFSATATCHLAGHMAHEGDDDARIEIDLSGLSPEWIFQDILRRSPTLDHVTVVSAFTCTKMRPDGFGGTAVLITADAVKGKSTHEILEDFFAEEDGAIPTVAGKAGSHVLLRLDEVSVRNEIRTLIESDADLAGRPPEAVTDADIRTACIAVAEHTDLSEELGSARFRAARAAIREAESRQI